MSKLIKLDKKITDLMTNRQKLGLRVRCRYDGYVQQLRDYLKNEKTVA